MDDAAIATHEIQAEQDLLCDLIDEGHEDTLVLVQAEEVFAKYLANHAYVRSRQQFQNADDTSIVEERVDLRVCGKRVRGRGDRGCGGGGVEAVVVRRCSTRGGISARLYIDSEPQKRCPRRPNT
jgi:hypothetical protein